MAVLGLRLCARAFSSCGERGPLFIAVRGPLTIAASLVAEHRLQTRRLSNCGSQAQLPRGMWDLPRPGLEPMSPALAGRFSTTAPPGKPLPLHFWIYTYPHFGEGKAGKTLPFFQVLVYVSYSPRKNLTSLSILPPFKVELCAPTKILPFNWLASLIHALHFFWKR